MYNETSSLFNLFADPTFTHHHPKLFNFEGGKNDDSEQSCTKIIAVSTVQYTVLILNTLNILACGFMLAASTLITSNIGS